MRVATRLDRYPGKMVSRLASHLIDRYAVDAESVVDPFCGSGAILAAAKRAGVSVAGIDVNPIAELFYRVKIEGFDAYRALELGRMWVAEAESGIAPWAVDWESKSYWFTPRTLDKFERLRAASRVVSLNNSDGWPVLLSYALAVRLCSRADQRSPKPFISRAARRSRAGRHFDPNRTILDLLRQLAALYGGRRNGAGRCQFVRADICDRRQSFGTVNGQSHAITSPPYINAQDYFRNFKLELYLLEGMLPFRVDGLRERFVGTERGRLLDAVPQKSMERTSRLVPELEDLEARAPRLCAVVHRYFHDMSRAFDAIENMLDDRACVVVVCGDNLVGGVKVCTWKILHNILEERGFELFDRFRDPIRDRMLAPKRLGHRGLIKEEVVSAYRFERGAGTDDSGRSAADAGVSAGPRGPGQLRQTDRSRR